MPNDLEILAAYNRQASAMVLNGLGQLGLLDRVSTDGSWWIHLGRTEQFAVLQDGVLKSLRLTHTGAESFFTLLELTAANLRSLLSAYARIVSLPGAGGSSYGFAQP